MTRFPANDIMSLVGETARYDLGESTGPDIRLADLLDVSGQASLDELSFGYATSEGDSRLRQMIADAHNVNAEDVVITMGGMHALFLSAFILCDKGDEAVTTSPLFPLALNALRVVGADVRILPLSFDQGYQLDLAALSTHLSPATRLVSLASPQNPSGVAMPAQTFRDVLALLEEKCPEAYLLVDETYREAAYGDDPIAASVVSLSPKVISIASLSKCHGAPGLRIGWAITRDPALREQLVIGKFNTVVSCSPICEALALKVLERRDPIIAERRQLLAVGRARTEDWVQENREFVEWVRPDAGAICCLRLRPSLFDDAAVSRFYSVLASKGVRVANGTWFGDDTRVFRLGFGLLAMNELQAALGALGSALRQTARP